MGRGAYSPHSPNEATDDGGRDGERKQGGRASRGGARAKGDDGTQPFSGFCVDFFGPQPQKPQCETQTTDPHPDHEEPGQ